MTGTLIRWRFALGAGVPYNREKNESLICTPPYVHVCTNHTLTGAVPANKSILTGTVPANKSLLTGTVPANKSLLTGTVPVNNSIQILIVILHISNGSQNDALK